MQATLSEIFFWSNLHKREGNRTLYKKRKRSRDLGIQRFSSDLSPEFLDLTEAGTETAACLSQWLQDKAVDLSNSRCHDRMER